MTTQDDSRISIYTTGGSMDKNYDLRSSDFLVGPPQVEMILAQANVSVPYEIHEFVRKDSLEISDDERRRLKVLIDQDPAKKILVTHGTDTMPHTARVLSSISGKVIVLTGAMQPAAFKDTDAHFNIGAAFLALQTLPHGTYLAMNGRIFTPFKVCKNTELRRFEES